MTIRTHSFGIAALPSRSGQIPLPESRSTHPRGEGPVALPSDPRLAMVCEAILRNPADRRTIDAWASFAAMGRRTLTRRFRAQMGTSLAEWQREVRLSEALSLLAAGSSIIQTSLAVGYESPTAFTAMFTRALGVPPSRYLQQDAAA